MAESNAPSANTQTSSLSVPKSDEATRSLSLATRVVHADDPMNSYADVAPALHVSTTFRYTSDPAKLNPPNDDEPPPHLPGGPISSDAHIYSRETAPNASRLELILSSLLQAPCLTYSSGLAAFHALLVHVNPRVVAIGNGYHGCHGVLKVYQKLTGCKIVDLFDTATWQNKEEGWKLGAGDVVHLESPVNPTGKAFNVAHFAQLAHERQAVLTIDATFAPPPLLDPFKWGADYVMHSGTKYFGGHSDMLCGVLAVSKRDAATWEKRYWELFHERVYLGSVMGSMEAWLGVRSLRTLELRVLRQSQNATLLVQFLHACLTGTEISPGARAVARVVAVLEHASLQHLDDPDAAGWLREQMPHGFGSVFALHTHSPAHARALPSKLHLFHHATSLGGVESLIEWRRMSDSTVAETLCRVSVGVEDWRDLRDDLVQACEALVRDEDRLEEPEITYQY
nr:putative trans-sulfuration enzyme [Quercus suber]